MDSTPQAAGNGTTRRSPGALGLMAAQHGVGSAVAPRGTPAISHDASVVDRCGATWAATEDGGAGWGLVDVGAIDGAGVAGVDVAEADGLEVGGLVVGGEVVEVGAAVSVVADVEVGTCGSVVEVGGAEEDGVVEGDSLVVGGVVVGVVDSLVGDGAVVVEAGVVDVAAASYVNVVDREPLGFVRVRDTLPAAWAGEVAVICRSLSTVNEAWTPSNVTLETRSSPENLLPEMTTLVPPLAGPLAGSIWEMVGRPASTAGKRTTRMAMASCKGRRVVRHRKSPTRWRLGRDLASPAVVDAIVTSHRPWANP